MRRNLTVTITGPQYDTFRLEPQPESIEEALATQRLIAASPRLYTALKALLESQFQHLREHAPREVAEAMEALGDAEVGNG